MARQELAVPLPHAPADLEAELASLDAEIAAVRTGAGAAGEDGAAGLSAVDAAAVRRLEAARAQELAAARRRADEASPRRCGGAGAGRAGSERRDDGPGREDDASAALAAARAMELTAIDARDAAQSALAEAESTARSAADRVAGARAAVAAASARHEDARRALDVAEGGGFSKAARARGGRAIGDGLIIEQTLQPAVDAALAGLGRAQVLARSEIAAVTGERGVAIPADALAADATPLSDAERRLVDGARARGGGRLSRRFGGTTSAPCRGCWSASCGCRTRPPASSSRPCCRPAGWP